MVNNFLSVKFKNHHKIACTICMIPFVLITSIVIMNHNIMNYKILLLVYSNFSMIPTIISCTENLMKCYRINMFRYSFIIELILSYLIIFVSSLYHLCDSGICIGTFNNLYSMDMIVSYTLISTYTFHIAQLNIINKLAAHALQLGMFSLVIQNNVNIYILWAYFFPFGVLVTKIIERIYKNKFLIFIKSHNYKNLTYGLGLLTIGILFGPLGLVNIGISYYWLYHSLLWHIPMMLASYFILKTPNHSEHNNVITSKTDELNTKSHLITVKTTIKTIVHDDDIVINDNEYVYETDINNPYEYKLEHHIL